MADVTISDLSPLTPSTGLVLPVSNGATTGSVTLSQVCGVMTSAQITSALGYSPLPKYGTVVAATDQTVPSTWTTRSGLSLNFDASINQTILASVYFSIGYESGNIDGHVRFLLDDTTPISIGANGFRVASQGDYNHAITTSFSYPITVTSGTHNIKAQVINTTNPSTTWRLGYHTANTGANQTPDYLMIQYY